MYFLKTGSPPQLEWLRIFEPLMIITGIVQPWPPYPRFPRDGGATGVLTQHHVDLPSMVRLVIEHMTARHVSHVHVERAAICEMCAVGGCRVPKGTRGIFRQHSWIVESHSAGGPKVDGTVRER
jgi:hypothetical protein